MSRFDREVLAIVAAIFLLAGCSRKKSEAPALSSEAALKSFRLSDDFRIELFVSEPQVLSPVEMVFDENGRIYVAEMLDYPEDPPPGKPGRSRIRLLEDRDGDGRIDQAIIFADQVLEVSGLQPWKGGLIVTSAPDILFMKDTNGDGKADERRVLYTGFPKVNPEAASQTRDWRSTTGSMLPTPDPTAALLRPIIRSVRQFWCAARISAFAPTAESQNPPAGRLSSDPHLTIGATGSLRRTPSICATSCFRCSISPRRRSSISRPWRRTSRITDRPSSPIFPLTQPQAWRVERTRVRQQRYNENQLNRTEQVGRLFQRRHGQYRLQRRCLPQGVLG